MYLFESARSHLIIRQMRPSDLDFTMECAASVVWMTETREEFEGFFASGSNEGLEGVF